MIREKEKKYEEKSVSRHSCSNYGIFHGSMRKHRIQFKFRFRCSFRKHSKDRGKRRAVHRNYGTAGQPAAGWRENRRKNQRDSGAGAECKARYRCSSVGKRISAVTADAFRRWENRSSVHKCNNSCTVYAFRPDHGYVWTDWQIRHKPERYLWRGYCKNKSDWWVCLWRSEPDRTRQHSSHLHEKRPGRKV